MQNSKKQLQFIPNKKPGNDISDPSVFIDYAIKGDMDSFIDYMSSFPEVVNIREKENGNVALHVASSKGSVNMVSLLLSRGANPSIQDIFGNTSLHYAVDKGRRDVAELLLTSGANVNAVDFRGNTPLHVACVNNDLAMVKLLLLHNADPEISDLANLRPKEKTEREDIKAIIERKIQANRGGENSSTEQAMSMMALGVGLGVGLGMAMAKQQQFFLEQQMALYQLQNQPKKKNVIGIQHSTDTPPINYALGRTNPSTPAILPGTANQSEKYSNQDNSRKFL